MHNNSSYEHLNNMLCSPCLFAPNSQSTDSVDVSCKLAKVHHPLYLNTRMFNVDTTVAFNKRNPPSVYFLNHNNKKGLTAAFPQVCYVAWCKARATTLTAILPSKLISVQQSRSRPSRQLHVIRNLPVVYTYVDVKGSCIDRWAGQASSSQL